MICDWMPNGNVRQYVKKYPEVDCVKLVRLFVAFEYQSISDAVR